MTAWVVRGGSDGEFEETFFSTNIAGIHFGLRQSITDFQSREALREQTRTRKAADQLWNFAYEIRSGDLVVLPRKRPRVIAVGRVSGDYRYREDLEVPHVRPVDWTALEIPRADFGQDLLNSIDGRATVYRPRATDAESRIERIVNQHMAGTMVYDTGSAEASVENDEFKVNLEEQITDRIIERVRQQFPGVKLERLVASILRASGYHAIETRQGPDGGIDVVAGLGELGFGHPRLCVQVKSGRNPVDIGDYNRLQGNIRSFGADHGLFVSLGDFTRAVRHENERSFFQIRLWGPRELADNLVEKYDALPADIQSEIPIKKRGILIETDE